MSQLPGQGAAPSCDTHDKASDYEPGDRAEIRADQRQKLRNYPQNTLPRTKLSNVDPVQVKSPDRQGHEANRKGDDHRNHDGRGVRGFQLSSDQKNKRGLDQHVSKSRRKHAVLVSPKVPVLLDDLHKAGSQILIGLRFYLVFQLRGLAQDLHPAEKQGAREPDQRTKQVHPYELFRVRIKEGPYHRGDQDRDEASDHLEAPGRLRSVVSVVIQTPDHAPDRYQTGNQDPGNNHARN